jgi:phosphohistidine phosphatase
MIVYLVRHGIAIDREDPNSPPEFERFLTREGIKKTREVAKSVHLLGIKPGAFVSSPYVRAMQTAEIFADVFGYEPSKIRQSVHLKPGANPPEFLKEIAALKSREVICFGHAPHMDQLISHMVGARSPITALKKAGVASVDLESVIGGKGTLQWLVSPKLLRRLD